MSTLITYNQKNLLPDQKAACVFNHMPKCGGTTLNVLLKKCFPASYVPLIDIFKCDFQSRNVDFLGGHLTDGLDHFLFKAFAKENLLQNHVFIGMVEYFNDSINELATIIPQLKNFPVISQNVTPKIDDEISELAKEYFYEKNRDDFDLFEKIEHEFLKRVRVTRSKKATPTSNSIVDNSVINQLQNKKDVDIVKESVFSGKLLPEMLTENGIYEFKLSRVLYSLQTEQDHKVFLAYLMTIMEEFKSCLYFAFACAKSGNLPELYTLAKLLFLDLQKFDPNNFIKYFTQMKIQIINTLAKKNLYNPQNSFDASLIPWLQNLHDKAHFTWKFESLFSQGLLYFSSKNFTKSVDLLKKATVIRPNHMKLKFALAKSLIACGGNGVNEVKQDALAALAQKPNKLWALQNLVLVAEATGSNEDIKIALQNALKENANWDYGIKLFKKLELN